MRVGGVGRLCIRQLSFTCPFLRVARFPGIPAGRLRSSPGAGRADLLTVPELGGAGRRSPPPLMELWADVVSVPRHSRGAAA